jgi:DNA polymerase III epsilon subunit-like protein
VKASFTGDPYDVWWKHAMVIFDVETTGLSADDGDRIVEIGFARFEHGKLVDQWGTLIYPERLIPAEASAIHGIRDEDVANAPRLFECLWRIMNICRGAYPVAYNAGFDRKFWEYEFARLSFLETPGLPIFDPQLRWFDPIIWVRQKDGIWAGNKLTEACERYNVSLVDAHSAVADSTATGRLIYEVLVDKLPPVTMTELLRRQYIYASRQDDERRAWFEKKGIPYE